MMENNFPLIFRGWSGAEHLLPILFTFSYYHSDYYGELMNILNFDEPVMQALGVVRIIYLQFDEISSWEIYVAIF